MTPLEYAVWGGLYALALLGAGAFVVSYCWTYGDFLAHDRINSILDKREDEEKKAEPFKYKPKGTK